MFRLLQPNSKVTFTKINEKINFPGESRTKEQEYRKAILFFRTHTASSPIIIQALNYFIQTPYLSASIINKCLTPISIPMELN